MQSTKNQGMNMPTIETLKSFPNAGDMDTGSPKRARRIDRKKMLKECKSLSKEDWLFILSCAKKNIDAYWEEQFHYAEDEYLRLESVPMSEIVDLVTSGYDFLCTNCCWYDDSVFKMIYSPDGDPRCLIGTIVQMHFDGKCLQYSAWDNFREYVPGMYVAKVPGETFRIYTYSTQKGFVYAYVCEGSVNLTKLSGFYELYIEGEITSDFY